MASNTLWQQSEVVRTKLFPSWMTMKFNVLTDFIQKGEVEMVGERDYRIPFKKTFGGRFGKYDPQLGDMGRGSSPTGDVMIQSFFNVRLNFEFDALQIKATTNRKVAIQNPFLQCIADGYKEMALLWDKTIHGNGTAVLATATAHSANSGVSVYTLNTNFGAQLLRRGQFYAVYDTTLATLKSSGVLYATAIDTTGRTVTLSGVVPSAAATDKICFEGVSGASPAGPRGVGYWVSGTASGTTAGINRANEPEIVSKRVDGTNGLAPEAVLAMYHRILNSRGEVANSLLGLAAPAQEAYARANVMAIQHIELNTDGGQFTDRMPSLKGKRAWNWGGIPHYTDIHQDAKTVPYIVPSLWGTARLAPTGFYETPGKTGSDARFIQLMAGSGGPAAGVWFGMCKDEDIYCTDPGAQGVIDTLPLGSLYA